MNATTKINTLKRWKQVRWMVDAIPEEFLLELDDPFWMLDDGYQAFPRLVPIVLWKYCQDC